MTGVWRSTVVAWIPRAVLLGLFAFAIFGPLANMLLWAVAAWFSLFVLRLIFRPAG